MVICKQLSTCQNAMLADNVDFFLNANVAMVGLIYPRKTQTSRGRPNLAKR
jgi:hypothetical protein